MEFLNYEIYMFDEKNYNFTLLYSSSNIYYIISEYSKLIKKYPNSFIKVCSLLQMVV